LLARLVSPKPVAEVCIWTSDRFALIFIICNLPILC
jgi:hypothetical protein